MEAHATGTQVGDPIDIALADLLGIEIPDRLADCASRAAQLGAGLGAGAEQQQDQHGRRPPHVQEAFAAMRWRSQARASGTSESPMVPNTISERLALTQARLPNQKPARHSEKTQSTAPARSKAK